MAPTGTRFEVEEFDGSGNFALWQTRVKNLLAQQRVLKGRRRSWARWRMKTERRCSCKQPQPYAACSAGADRIVYDRGLLLLAGLV